MAFAPVQTVSGQSGASAVASYALAFTTDVVASNTLLAAFGCWFTGAFHQTAPISDSQGNTWTKRSDSTALQIWTCTANASGANTVTIVKQTSDTYFALGLAELSGSDWTFTQVGIGFDSDSGTTMTMGDESLGAFVANYDDAGLFAFLTAQGSPAGAITENGAWTLVGEYQTDAVEMPYSFIWRSAGAGSYTAVWTIGASITCYMCGLVVEASAVNVAVTMPGATASMFGGTFATAGGAGVTIPGASGKMFAGTWSITGSASVTMPGAVAQMLAGDFLSTTHVSVTMPSAVATLWAGTFTVTGIPYVPDAADPAVLAHQYVTTRRNARNQPASESLCQHVWSGGTAGQVVSTSTLETVVWAPERSTVPITDGVAAPLQTMGQARVFVDTADGNLKVIFGDGTIKTIVVKT